MNLTKLIRQFEMQVAECDLNSVPSVEPPPLAGLKDRSDSGVAEPNNGLYRSGLDSPCKLLV